MEIFHIRDSLDHIHTLLGIRRRTSVPPSLSDPFQRHPALQIKLYGAAFGALEVMSPKFVSGHLAYLPLKVQRNEVVATISMLRVSYSFHSFSTHSDMQCRLSFFVPFLISSFFFGICYVYVVVVLGFLFSTTCRNYSHFKNHKLKDERFCMCDGLKTL